MFLIQFFEGVEHGGGGLAVLIGQIEEIDDLAQGGVFDDDHVF